MVVHQLRNLMTYPEVAERAADGRLTLLGWHYSIDTGVVEQYDRDQLAFHPVKAEAPNTPQPHAEFTVVPGLVRPSSELPRQFSTRSFPFDQPKLRPVPDPPTGSFFGMNNILAGLIVAVVALPLCIAFAIASGASPMAGVVSGVVGGAIAAVFGSSRFQVSGPAAAFITVIAGIIASHGLPVLMAATFCAGFIVIAIGLLKLGRLMEFMPHPIIVGFTTGIGLLILIGQIPVALGVAAEGDDAIAKLIDTIRDIHTIRIQEVAIVALSFVAALGWSRTRFNRWVPAPLVALCVGLGTAELMAWQGIPVATVGAAYNVSIEGLGFSADFLQTILTNTNAVLLSALTLGLLIAVEIPAVRQGAGTR